MLILCGRLGNSLYLLVITCQSDSIHGREQVTLSREIGVRSLPAVARIPNTLSRPFFDLQVPICVGLIADDSFVLQALHRRRFDRTLHIFIYPSCLNRTCRTSSLSSYSIIIMCTTLSSANHW